ncbi:hypothetical protein AC579_3910 [Pseudocercospora musae]|uniref:Glycosyltransferase family 34 protein n=1 Tax=Pseudocercospora musae TaxID=113226 RepID=A0A139HZN5_9PEZI|nr:hypothetical protein AC579_3910 [Pseudocercospora musae]
MPLPRPPGPVRYLSRCVLILVTVFIATYLAIHLTYTVDDDKNHDKDLPERPSKYAIVCMTNRATSYDDITIQNKISYARTHGYDLLWDFDYTSPYPKVWDKLYNTRHAALSEKYSWIWALDFDALITNTTIRLEDILTHSLKYAEDHESKTPSTIQIILTKDHEPINLGSVLFRSSPWIIDFLAKWSSRYGAICPQNGAEPLCNEQEILRDMLAVNAEGARDHTVIVPQKWMNSYAEEINRFLDPKDEGRVWEKGDFVIHFAGASWWLRENVDPVGELMRKYGEMVDL